MSFTPMYPSDKARVRRCALANLRVHESVARADRLLKAGDTHGGRVWLHLSDRQNTAMLRVLARRSSGPSYVVLNLDGTTPEVDAPGDTFQAWEKRLHERLLGLGLVPTHG